MGYSLPVITTNIAGIPDIVEHGKNGFCVKPRCPEVLAEKMAWMIEHPKEGMQMGLVGRKILEEKFTLEKYESNICSILKDCLES